LIKPTTGDDTMSRMFRTHWQYITVIFGILSTAITLAFREGAFRTRCSNMEAAIELAKIESAQTKSDIVNIKLNVQEIKTMLEMMQKNR